jgi:hypothetical protein
MTPTLESTTNLGLAATLIAPGRSPEIPESDDAYGWLVGSWELDIRHYRTDVRTLGLKGEVHFAWVLEGRAIQDTWIMPPRQHRPTYINRSENMYGTTLRIWDSAIRAWRVTWLNPITGQRDELIGRRVGNDLVQVGRHADGTPIRWMFRDLTPDSFRWTGEVLAPDGQTWNLEAEFHARRMRTQQEK